MTAQAGTDDDCSTLFAGTQGLDNAKRLVTEFKTGKIEHMTPQLWRAKKIVDSTLHPGRFPTCFIPAVINADHV